MSTSPRWGGRRLMLLVGCVLGVLTIALLAGGCVRMRVAIALGPDDLITGEIVMAVVVQTEQEQGSVLSPPADLAAKVRTEPYRQDGYAGTRLLFNGLTFDEFGRLLQSNADALGEPGFELRRAGSFVLFSGRVDLTGVPNPERTDVQVRISFPGTVSGTNGDQQDETVSWIVQPGQVTELTATARYAEPGTRSWGQWALLVGGLAAFVVLIIALLAYLTHRRYADEPVRIR